MRIYLSSTFSDLEPEREAVYKALRRIRHDVIAMEDYVAADRRPLDRCRDDVRDSDLYIGVFGWRYGYIPAGEERSITELELREAQRQGKTCLIFMREENSRPTDLDADDGQRILELRQALGREYLVSFFVSPEDLAVKVTAAVANLFGELSEAIGKLDMPLSDVLEKIKQLGELPRLSVAEIEEEVAHLQADAMNWLEQPAGVPSAQRRLTEARRLIAESVREAADSPSLLTLLGYIEKTQWQVSRQTGDARRAADSLDLAARYFRAALSMEPTDIGALNGQANICAARGDYERAVAIGRYIAALRPDYAAAFWDLGISLTPCQSTVAHDNARVGPMRSAALEAAAAAP